MSKHISLTPELEHQILASIRSGGFPHIAGAAWGVGAALWQKWRRAGAAKKSRRLYRDFFSKVEQAHAQARLKAEIDAREADVRFWLKHGPAREMPDNPGWSALARPSPPQAAATSDLFAAPETLQLLATLRAALAPHPEALAAVTAAIEKSGVRRQESGIRNQESGIRNQESGIRNQESVPDS